VSTLRTTIQQALANLHPGVALSTLRRVDAHDGSTFTLVDDYGHHR
jgi:UDP-N-acetylmuramate-alanine ligase